MNCSQYLILAIVLAALSQSALVHSRSKSSTLKFVNVLFRHGDRANDAATTYPKDPYKNESYYPYGIGQLTNRGKQTEYSLGKMLRRRYNDFLGQLYTPDVVEAVSTDMPRTKMSLQLVLAGLYPPKGTLMEWERNLNWQPIPYNYLVFTEDHLMSFPLAYCSKYASLYQEYLRSAEGQAIEAKYSEYYPYLSEHTGLNVTSLLDVFGLYFGLTSELEWGLVLPEWTNKVYPGYLYNAASDFYVLSSGTHRLKQLSGGFLLKKIVMDISQKLNGEFPEDRKIMLYSGHEINVAYLLRAMEVFVPHVPRYGSCIMLEVHTIDGEDGIKVYYEDYSEDEPKLLTVPGCDSLCPVDKFAALLLENFPLGDEDCDADAVVLHKYEYLKKRYGHL